MTEPEARLSELAEKAIATDDNPIFDNFHNERAYTEFFHSAQPKAILDLLARLHELEEQVEAAEERGRQRGIRQAEASCRNIESVYNKVAGNEGIANGANYCALAMLELTRKVYSAEAERAAREGEPDELLGAAREDL